MVQVTVQAHVDPKQMVKKKKKRASKISQGWMVFSDFRIWLTCVLFWDFIHIVCVSAWLSCIIFLFLIHIVYYFE